MKRLSLMELSLFDPEFPGKSGHELDHYVRDGEGDGKGGAKFKRTHYRPDSSDTFPYEPPHDPQQSEEELEGMLNLESFITGMGVPRRSSDPAMSLNRLSYNGGESEAAAAGSKDYKINLSDRSENKKRERDRTLSIDLVGDAHDPEIDEEEFLSHIPENMINARARAGSEGSMMTTKNGWDNGSPTDTGIKDEDDEELEAELGIDEFPIRQESRRRKLSLKDIYEDYSMGQSRVQAANHSRPAKEDEEFFDLDNEDHLEDNRERDSIIK